MKTMEMVLPNKVTACIQSDLLLIKSSLYTVGIPIRSIFDNDSFCLVSLKYGYEVQVCVSTNSESKSSKMEITRLAYKLRSIVDQILNTNVTRINVIGVGYRVNPTHKWIYMRLGFSHLLVDSLKSGFFIWSIKKYNIVIMGADRQKVGYSNWRLCNTHHSDPYKGKGLHRDSDQLILKPGKKE